MAIDRSVRRSQTISPFGVGGIYDLGSESFVAMDIKKWLTQGEPDIRLPRLEAILQVTGFRSAPVAGEANFPGSHRAGKAIPYHRFPAWLFCPSCRLMTRWSAKNEQAGKRPVCSGCSNKINLVPMRFMAVCKAGHLMDVPWDRWAVSGAKPTKAQRECPEHQFEFRSDPSRGAGLQSLKIVCRYCDVSNDLERLPHKDSLNPIFKCSGRHPWESWDQSAACTEIPQVVQRGASNAYYPIVVSAIDIRSSQAVEDDSTEMIKAHANWGPLSDAYAIFGSLDNPFIDQYLQKLLDDDGLVQRGITREMILEELDSSPSASTTAKAQDNSDEDLLLDEWKAFIDPQTPDHSADFLAEAIDLDAFADQLPAQEQPVWAEFRKLISQVTIARKIRVVRALRGFNRLEPDMERIVQPTLAGKPSWLPATEIFGEGIFISLDPEMLSAWEVRQPSRHLQTMKENKKRSNLAFLPEIDSRFVLLHTLSHLLMRQLCFECGYSSSALSERIYSDPETKMAGLLIYTASADSEGALGGLVREGLPDRLYKTFKSALFRAAWCSNDPICSEMSQQGVQGLNRAACHACTLVAETSCDYANSLLDRTVVLGNPDKSAFGYFSPFIEKIEQAL